MVNKFFLVGVLFFSVCVWGCTGSGGKNTEGGGVATNHDSLKVDPSWEAEPVREWQVLTGPKKAVGATPKTEADKPTTTEKKSEEAAPKEVPNQNTEQPVKEVGVPEGDGSSVKLVPETEVKKDEMETVFNSSDPLAAELAAAEHEAVRELASLGAKRCMTCDDVSDLNQCVTCGHHHKKSLTCPTEKLKARCEACYGKTGETLVVYPQDASCGACGEVHENRAHCPHCSKNNEAQHQK